MSSSSLYLSQISTISPRTCISKRCAHILVATNKKLLGDTSFNTCINRYYTPSSFNNQSSSSSSNVIYLLAKEDAWKLGDLHRALLGKRCLIVGSSDEISSQLSKKMWFHLQKVGIDATFFTIRVPFVDSSVLDEGITLAKRTGATSLLCIGNGTTRDVTMGLKFCLDNNISGGKIESAILGSSNLKKDDGRSGISVINIADDISPVASFTHWKAFHSEDNVLMQYGNSKPADIVVYDSNIIASVRSSLTDISMCVSVAYLIDATFAFAFSSLSQGKTADEIKEIFSNSVHKANSSFSTALNVSGSVSGNDNTHTHQEPQYQLAILISTIRNKLQEENLLDPRFSPTILSILADLRDVQLLSKYRLQVPTAWSMVEMMSQYIDVCKTYMNRPPRTINEELIQESVKLSTDLMYMCTDMNESNILDMVKISKNAITAFASMHPKKYIPSKVADKYTPMTSEALLEGVILTEEDRVGKFNALQIASSSGHESNATVNILKKPEAIPNSSGDGALPIPFVSKLGKGSKLYNKNECKITLLQSDFAADFSETVLKTYL